MQKACSQDSQVPKIATLYEIALLPLHEPELKESNVSESDDILVIDKEIIFEDELKLEVIYVSSNEPEIIILSNSDTILSSISACNIDNSKINNRLIIY